MVPKHIIQLLTLLFIYLFSCCAFSLKPLVVDLESHEYDTRVLIDISSSMAESDPGEVRRLSLKLLGKVLPTESKAGIWTFDEKINSVVPLGVVNSRWLNMVEKGTFKLLSENNKSNLSEALQLATSGWVLPDFTGARNIIVFSDGGVGGDAMTWDSKEQVQDLLETMLPELKRQGAKVHSIGLSKNNNLSILKKISEETDGVFREVADSEQLQLALLEIFKFAYRPGSLPIEDKKFHVDKYVKDLTILVHAQKAKDRIKRDVTLQNPFDEIFTEKNYPSNIKWHKQGLLELITIENPHPGDWAFHNLDFSYDTIISSNLDIVASKFPTNLYAGESLPISVKLINGDDFKISKELINNIEVMVKLTPNLGAAKIYSLEENLGEFYIDLDPSITANLLGEVSIELIAKGKTFSRKKDGIINFNPLPFSSEFKTTAMNDQERVVDVNVQLNSDKFMFDTVSVTAVVEDSMGKIFSYDLVKQGINTFSYTLYPSQDIQEYKVKYYFHGMELSNKKVSIESSAQKVIVPEIIVPEPQIIEVEKIVYKDRLNTSDLLQQQAETLENDKNINEIQSKTNLVLKAIQSITKEQSVNWSMIWISIVVILIFNLLLLVGVLFYRKVQNEQQFNNLIKTLDRDLR